MQTINKYTGEAYLYGMDFSQKTVIKNGDTLSSVTSVTASPTAGITIGSGTISGNIVSFTISGGTISQEYLITVTCVTAANRTTIGEGILYPLA